MCYPRITVPWLLKRWFWYLEQVKMVTWCTTMQHLKICKTKTCKQPRKLTENKRTLYVERWKKREKGEGDGGKEKREEEERKRGKKKAESISQNGNSSYLWEGLLWVSIFFPDFAEFYKFSIKGTYHFYSQKKLYIREEINDAPLGWGNFLRTGRRSKLLGNKFL